MRTQLPVYLGKETTSELVHYSRERAFDRFMLVADQNTYPVLGQSVEQILRDQGFDVRSVILRGEEVIADERYLMQVLVHADNAKRVYLAVGSGTITDIVRFVSHRTRTSFISLPTAPSVDGYASVGAPLVFDGLKQTIACQPPLAIFADLKVLCAAPRRMIAAGFGDLVGKFTSVADWQLGHLLWAEPYAESIAQRSRQAALNCASEAEAIGAGTAESIRVLMEGLIESGLCILDFGNSHPASGGEHHLSHFWELKLLREHRPALLHGAKIGVASIITAQLYDRLRRLSRDEAADRLKNVQLPDRGRLIQGIQSAYGPAADQIIQEQAAFLNMSEQTVSELKQRILDCWNEVQAIANTVPASEQLVDWLHAVGAPVDGRSLGLSEEEVALAVEYGHYLRKRFTILKLAQLIGL